MEDVDKHSFGGYTSHGATLQWQDDAENGIQVPPMQGRDGFPPNFAAGGYAGGGGAIFLSNARHKKDLEKTVATFHANLDAKGVQAFGLSFSWGNGIWHMTFAPPGGGLWIGGEAGIQHTTTKAFRD